MKKTASQIENKLLTAAYKNPKYKGKEVVVIGDEMHIISTKNAASREKLLTSLVKSHPGKTPLIALIPKETTLILLF